MTKHKYWNGEQVAGTLTSRNAGGGQRMPDKDNFVCVLADVVDVNDWTCFSCKYRNILETSHEWIDNFCQHPLMKDGKPRSPLDACENYEKDRSYYGEE